MRRVCGELASFLIDYTSFVGVEDVCFGSEVSYSAYVSFKLYLPLYLPFCRDLRLKLYLALFIKHVLYHSHSALIPIPIVNT